MSLSDFTSLLHKVNRLIEKGVFQMPAVELIHKFRTDFRVDDQI